MQKDLIQKMYEPIFPVREIWIQHNIFARIFSGIFQHLSATVFPYQWIQLS